jgi:hypothetical protein
MLIDCELRDLTNQTMNQMVSTKLIFESLVQETCAIGCLSECSELVPISVLLGQDVSIAGNFVQIFD